MIENTIKTLEDGNILAKNPKYIQIKWQNPIQIQGETHPGKNTKMSYYYIDADGK